MFVWLVFAARSICSRAYFMNTNWSYLFWISGFCVYLFIFIFVHCISHGFLKKICYARWVNDLNVTRSSNWSEKCELILIDAESITMRSKNTWSWFDLTFLYVQENELQVINWIFLSFRAVCDNEWAISFWPGVTKWREMKWNNICTVYMYTHEMC